MSKETPKFSNFMYSGGRVTVSPKESFRIDDVLDPVTYAAKYNQETGQFYLQVVADMPVPDKIYGDTLSMADRVMRTYDARDKSTGVLLSGEKGSGKTLLAKVISAVGRRVGMPTILVQDCYHGSGFDAFIQSISTPSVIIFDEFEKVYDDEAQPAVLTLFDGVFPSKKLFIVTCNKVSKIDENMINRPGRLYYHLSYSGLEENFIREYSMDNIVDPKDREKRVDDIVKLSVIIDPFNFDLLQTIIEEMNRFGESAYDVVKFVNAKPQKYGRSLKVSVFDKSGNEYRPYDTMVLIDDPFRCSFSVNFTLKNDKKQNGNPNKVIRLQNRRGGVRAEDIGVSAEVHGKNLVGVDYKNKVFTYRVTDDTGKIEFFVKLTPYSYSYDGDYGAL